MHVWVFAREVRRRKRVSRTRRMSFLLRNGFRADQCIVKMLGAPSKHVADKKFLLTDRCSFLRRVCGVFGERVREAASSFASRCIESARSLWTRTSFCHWQRCKMMRVLGRTSSRVDQFELMQHVSSMCIFSTSINKVERICILHPLRNL